MSPSSARAFRDVAPVAVVVLTAAVLGALHGGFTDLDVYRYGGRAVIEQLPLYEQRDPVSDLPFTYPPIAALAMVPLTLVPGWLCSALWTATSVAALAGAVVVVRRALGLPAPGWWVAGVTGGAVVLEPVWQNLAFGQVNTLVLLAVLVDVLGPRRPWSGVLLGIVAAVKLTPLVFVVLLLLVGRRSAAFCAVGVFGGCALVGLVAVPGAASYWSDGLLRASRVGPPALAHNQSVYGVLTRALGHEPSTLVWVAVAGPVALAMVLVAAGWWRRGDRSLGTCLAALAMLLASPVSWSHHWVWAVPVALVLWERSRGGAVLWTAVFVARPMLWPPWGDGAELDWGPGEQVLGSAYVLSALAVGGWAWLALRRPPQDTTLRTCSASTT